VNRPWTWPCSNHASSPVPGDECATRRVEVRGLARHEARFALEHSCRVVEATGRAPHGRPENASRQPERAHSRVKVEEEDLFEHVPMVDPACPGRPSVEMRRVRSPKAGVGHNVVKIGRRSCEAHEKRDLEVAPDIAGSPRESSGHVRRVGERGLAEHVLARFERREADSRVLGGRYADVDRVYGGIVKERLPVCDVGDLKPLGELTGARTTAPRNASDLDIVHRGVGHRMLGPHPTSAEDPDADHAAGSLRARRPPVRPCLEGRTGQYSRSLRAIGAWSGCDPASTSFPPTRPKVRAAPTDVVAGASTARSTASSCDWIRAMPSGGCRPGSMASAGFRSTAMTRARSRVACAAR
jgi:hypothetical protein